MRQQGSTAGKRLGNRSRKGRPAALFTSSAARGIGAPSLRLFTFLALAIVGLLALAASSAFAAETRPYTGVSFGPDGTAGTASFDNVQGIAVDQESGDIYVYDAGAGKIYKFDSAGAPA